MVEVILIRHQPSHQLLPFLLSIPLVPFFRVAHYAVRVKVRISFIPFPAFGRPDDGSPLHCLLVQLLVRVLDCSFPMSFSQHQSDIDDPVSLDDAVQAGFVGDTGVPHDGGI